jgi:prevent-host-death family protein
MVKTNLRDLKAHLSEYVRKAADGEDIVVSVRGRVRAKLIAGETPRGLDALADEPGIMWNRGKPKGLSEPKRLDQGRSLSDWVLEDRR